ncbi:MAG TPA: sigma 54-interacting transcriptional regulator [Kofleriaceae bacterium]|nr:sigma 54-interacting transcriptional regulator [Kofleriaceae bacterium]
MSALSPSELAEPASDGLRLIVLGHRQLLAYALPARGSLTIGRDRSCAIAIDDPSIDPQHARLACDALTIEDLGSAEGVRLRGARLEPGRPAALHCDEVAQLGAISIVVQRAPLPAAVGAVPPGLQPMLSAAMRALYQLVDRVAVGTISVLILGETGVGKEVLAEAIHRRSTRAAAPLLRLNCAALTDTLLESELFGHEKGAFTGAAASKQGLLESAHGGTVFLDEIGELPLPTQVKLLRVLESREVLPVGAVRPRPIDVRFIAATHRDLEARIDQGQFREDLYFRLNGITLRIPPLRERLDELETLAGHFVAMIAHGLGRPAPLLSAAAVARLRGHTWPGNIRELRNCLERAVLLCHGDCITGDDIVVVARRSREPTPAPPDALGDLRRRTAAVEREHIVAALARAAGNQKAAAQLLGISRRTLANKLDAFGIDRPRKGRA